MGAAKYSSAGRKFETPALERVDQVGFIFFHIHGFLIRNLEWHLVLEAAKRHENVKAEQSNK